MEIRPFTPDDAHEVEAFLSRIPTGESAFFKEDISAPRTVEQWSENPTAAQRFIAVDGDGSVVGYTAVNPGVGWSSHVGEIRLVVGPEQRRSGIGRQLARAALRAGVEAGLSKMVVEVVADQQPAINLFTTLGFTPEALLRDHVRDRNGDLHDLMLLAHNVRDVQSTMATVGIEDALN